MLKQLLGVGQHRIPHIEFDGLIVGIVLIRHNVEPNHTVGDPLLLTFQPRCRREYQGKKQ